MSVLDAVGVVMPGSHVSILVAFWFDTANDGGGEQLDGGGEWGRSSS